ncbi:hypothetical protein vseg_000680 [Gypsophila vaccaria]
MKKPTPPTTTTTTPTVTTTATTTVTKFFLCFETKPLLTTLLFLSLLTLLFSFPPHLHPPLLPPPPSSATTTAAATTTTSNNLSLHSLTIRKTAQTAPSPPPNKRLFQPHGNAAALFVSMGAYRGGTSSFTIVGLASKPLHVYGSPWFKCEWVPGSGPAGPTRAKAVKTLPDWGYGRVYTVVVVTCDFGANPNANNSGGKLHLYAYYSQSPRAFEKFAVMEEGAGEYNETKYVGPPKLDYLYCGSSLYGNLSAVRVREWMAYHAWLFGERSHFVFHDAGGVSDEVRAVLDPWIKLGRATLEDIRDESHYDGYYYNQFLVVNDCLHRYKFDAKWTFFFDVDEYVYVPQSVGSLESVMKEFESFSQFTIEQNPMSSRLCLNHSTTPQDYSRQWGFEKLVFRDSRTKIRRDRKYAIQARQARATGVHMSENVIGKTLHKTESKIRYYHYHNTIQVQEEPCRVFLPPSAEKGVTMFDKLPYVYDDNMKKRADMIKQFERETLGTYQHPS